MTPDEVRARVAQIAEQAHDPETAHGEEDELHQDVLDVIAGLGGPAAELAAEALRTRDIDYPRWFA